MEGVPNWLEAHPIDDHITLANAYFVIFLSFLTQEIVPGFWIYTAATPLTLLELSNSIFKANSILKITKSLILILVWITQSYGYGHNYWIEITKPWKLTFIEIKSICVGKSTGLWSLWIFFSQRKQERFQCWGYEVSKVMQHVWKDAFPGRTDGVAAVWIQRLQVLCDHR
jgi:hypothetical protein